MDTNLIRTDIQEQISVLNDSFTNIWGKITNNDIVSDKVDLLDDILKSVKREYKFYKNLTYIVIPICLILSLVAYFKTNLNLSKSGLLIYISFVMFMQFFRIYKLKTNLEHKIYLLRLLEKINK